MIVAGQAQARRHAATLPAELACLSTSSRAVDARALAVPDAEHAIDLGAGKQIDLLAAPDRGRRRDPR